MKTSESISHIMPALFAVQKVVESVPKNASNTHFKNKYADLKSVIGELKPALNDAGIMFLQTGSPDDNGRLRLTTRLVHVESCEWIEDTLTMPLSKQDPQAFGSAMTYARRYSLAAFIGLYQDDDDGNAASGAGAKKESSFDDLETLDDFTDVYIAMREADDLEALQGIFGSAWNKAKEKDKKALKEAYDKRKGEITK